MGVAVGMVGFTPLLFGESEDSLQACGLPSFYLGSLKTLCGP